MLLVEGTVIRVRADEKVDSKGEAFTAHTLEVFGGGDLPHYLDLPKGFDRDQIPAPGQPIRAAVAVRAYATTKNKWGAGASLTLRAVIPSIPVAQAV
jgi:hypothetical protein